MLSDIYDFVRGAAIVMGWTLKSLCIMHEYAKVSWNGTIG